MMAQSLPDARPLALPTLTLADLPPVTGTPATRAQMRAHMPWSQALIADHWREFGGLGAVVAAEGGYVYRWQRG